MKKKVFTKSLSMLLAFVLLLSQLIGVTVLADGLYEYEDYTDKSTYEIALSYLEMMGLSYEYDEALPVTRGYAVNSIVAALGLEAVAQNGNAAYTKYEKMADVAHSLGILSGSAPREWSLSSNVTPSELCKMFVVALGYGNVITGENPFPAQYVNQATRLGLTEHFANTNASNVTYEEFVIMLYQAMQTSALRMTGVTGTDLTYSQSEDYTLETVYLDTLGLTKATGFVEADYYTTMVSADKCQLSQIRIDGVYYNCDSALCSGLVGMKAEIVYGKKEGMPGDTLVGIRAYESNRIYTFNRNSDTSLSGNKLYYYNENDERKYITLSDSFVIVYNNKLCTSYNVSDFDFADSYMKLIDNNDDKKYDVIFISESESAIVDRVVEEKIYLSHGTINSKKLLDLSEADEISYTIRTLDGTPALISDIEAGDAISCVASKDFDYVEIIILDEQKQGVFESLNDQSGIVTVSGVQYGLKISAGDFVLGNTYIFITNEYNEIFYLETISTECSYIVNKMYDRNGLSDSAKIKIYDPEDGLRVYDLAKKVTIDSVSFDNQSVAVAAIATQTLADVKFNSLGEVKEIEYLESYSSPGQRTYCEYAKGFNDMDGTATLTPFRYDEKTTFFYVPANNDDDGFGFIVPLVDGDSYMTEAFSVNEVTGCAGAVIVELDTDVRENTQLTYRSDIAIIKSISQIVDVDLQPVYRIQAYHDGKLDTLYSGHYSDVFGICANLREGDVISYVENYNDEIVHLQRLRSLYELDDYFLEGYGTTNEQIYGQAVVLTKNVLTNTSKYLVHQMSISTTSDYNNLTNINIWADVDNPYDSSSEFCEWYVYNKSKKEVAPASVDDIMTYDNVGADATKLFVQRTRSDTRLIVIIEDR